MNKKMKTIAKRKKDHLKIALSDEAQIGNPGFDKYRLIHNALPEIDFGEIDTSTTFPCLPAGRLGKKVNSPFFISCMTGGVEEGAQINKNLAKAAQKKGIAMGVGSQRIAIEHPELSKMFEVRKYAPDIPIIANLGLVQLNCGYGLKECELAVKMIKADALAFHLNPLHELLQDKGNTNWKNLLSKLEKIVKKLSVPVIVKEVGFGLGEDVVRRLCSVGVRFVDTAGRGGTNWAYVELSRNVKSKNSDEVKKLMSLFTHWGIATADSILAAKKVKAKFKDLKILGSGGVRSGVDIAKSICLGADLVGIAAPFAKAALKSEKEVEKLIERLGKELKIAMFGVGAENINKLQNSALKQLHPAEFSES